jgi:FAD/FMN-containing dehydrogenase
MDHEESEQLSRGDSFIKQYVKQHKQELEALRAKVKALEFIGQWFIIGDPEYTEKRLQYATTSFAEAEVSPRIILYPISKDEIKKALGLCRELKMAIAVRTGGHQYCGYSSTAPVNMQLDLSETFREYDYDDVNNVLRCGVSHALGAWAGCNNKKGIYLPMGMCAHVHLGGHVHTGGWGIVARSHGLLADHVLAFDIIFASGAEEHIVRPVKGKTSQHNDDVYYAVLGGGRGGDFGIVTHWEFSPLRDQDYPNTQCYTFLWLWTKEKMEAVVRKMEELSKLCANGTVPSDYEFMLTITGYGWMNVLSEPIKAEITARASLTATRDGVSLPALPMIQMWMCFTNKGGANEKFDDQWFESFVSSVGTPFVAHRKRIPVSEGIAQYFIMNNDREMDYPFVKRARVTMAVPEGFAKTYTERMYEIMSLPTALWQHAVSQMQIYAGGAVAENGKAGITAYSWRNQALAMGHDSFYSDGQRANAEQWQKENDEIFIGKKAFADADMRNFAYTFGERVLEKVWRYHYDSQEKYDRLRRIKGELDPDGLFSADEFSLKPL